MLFRDREEAAGALAEKLRSYRLNDPLVLAIPRGAVPMGAVIAERLGGELDVVLVHKFSPTWHPELAVGAVTEDGEVLVTEVAKHVGLSDEDIETSAQGQVRMLRERRKLYTPYRKSISPEGRDVVIVDDGVATGATMRAAVLVMKRKKAARVVVAAPVASQEAAMALKGEGVEICFLDTPEDFYAVSQFYLDFPQVEDSEVIGILSGSETEISVSGEGVTLRGIVSVPNGARGVVLFAHGSGSGRHSPRNQFVARRLQQSKIATVLMDLLEEDESYDRQKVFNIELLARRLLLVADWVVRSPKLKHLPIGLFGASTGAGAALVAVAQRKDLVRAVVSRGGRPDLAMERLPEVEAPTLLIVGGEDEVVIELNQEAFEQLRCEKQLVIVPGATHLFDEPGTLEQVADLAAAWFERRLPQVKAPAARTRRAGTEHGARP